MLIGADLTAIVAAALIVALCVYRWGYVAGLASALDRNRHAEKIAHRAESRADETQALAYAIERQLLKKIERADGKAEGAHAKADRIEQEFGVRLARLEGDKRPSEEIRRSIAASGQ